MSGFLSFLSGLRREQHQQLGGGELSRLITSMAIGAVVVEVQTEEELAVQAACGWEIREED